MKSPLHGVVFLILLMSIESLQAKNDDDSLVSMAYGSNDVSDYDYDDIDDIDGTEEGLISRLTGKRSDAPPGAWNKRQNHPTDIWGKRLAIPPGAWGTKKYGKKRQLYHERRAEANGDQNRFQEDLKLKEKFRQQVLERRKLALIDSLRRVKEDFDN